MKRKLLTKEDKQMIKPWFFLGIGLLLVFLFAMNVSLFYEGFLLVLDLLQPLIIAIAIAYILNIPMMFIERNIKKRVKQDGFMYKKVRGISVFLTIIFAFVVLILIASIVFPRILESLGLLFNNMGELLQDLFTNIDGLLAKLNIDYRMDDIKQIDNLINMPWDDVFKNILTVLGSSANGIVNNAMSFTSTFLLWFMAFMFSLYLLNGKENLIRQFREVILVFCKKNKATQLFAYGKQANIIFKNFITGQVIEACILGVLYYIGMLIFGFPYPELIAMIIGLFSLVPVFGPICAMFIGAFLILSQDFVQALWFFVFFQVLSQLEDNYIYPKVVGNSVGLPGIWVILSIFVLGDVFGIVGMICAVPVTAFVYTVFADWIHKTLDRRKQRVNDEGIIVKVEEEDPVDDRV